MPRIRKVSEGEYITIYSSKSGKLLLSPIKKSLVVKTRPRSFDVQTTDDKIMRVFPRQLKKPKGNFSGAEYVFLKNLCKTITRVYNPYYGTYEERISEGVNVSKDQLKEQINQIKKNYLVEKVYITKKGNLVVKTVDLPIFNPRGRKNLRRKVGRMAIKINPSMTRINGKISVTNFDWQRGSYVHPHGTGSDFCFGDARSLLNNAFFRADVFSVIEIMLAMLTQFSSSGDCQRWLGSRTKKIGYSMSFMEKKAKIKWN